MDRVSELPDFVIQHILYFLSAREAAQTSVLSKTWQRTWSTYPISDFDLVYNGKQETRDKNFMFKDKTLVRIGRFRLSVRTADRNLDPFVEECLGIAVKSGVKELDLSLMPACSSHELPQSIFAAKSLTSLKVEGFSLRKVQASGNMIKLSYLKTLILGLVYLDDRTIESLMCSCPLIEKLTLFCCRGLKSLKVDGRLRYLRELKVSILADWSAKKVDVEAQSLESFSYFDGEVPCLLNIDASRSRNLKNCYLTRAIVTDMFLQSLVPELPLLEILTLEQCHELADITLSSDSLKCIFLTYCKKLVSFRIDAPSLIWLEYSGETIPSSCFTNTSSQLRIRSCIRSPINLDTYWFLRLRGFLASLNPFDVSLKLFIECKINSFNVKDLREVSVPPRPEIRSLSVVLKSSSVRYLALLDGLFWSCLPKRTSVH